MSSLPKNGDIVCDTSQSKSLETLGDFIRERKKIHEKISSLENQIKLLEMGKKRYETTIFDQRIQQLVKERQSLINEIGPVIVMLAYAISWLVPQDKREIMAQYTYSNQSYSKIALYLRVSDYCVSTCVRKYSEMQVPSNFLCRSYDR